MRRTVAAVEVLVRLVERMVLGADTAVEALTVVMAFEDDWEPSEPAALAGLEEVLSVTAESGRTVRDRWAVVR